MDARTMAGFGKQFHSRIRTFFDTPLGPDATPLELVQAVLDQVEQRVQPVGRGRRVFPYAGMTVQVLTTDASSPAVAAAFQDFGLRTIERLAELRCDTPSVLDVDVTCVHEAPGTWAPGQRFAVDYLSPPAPATAGQDDTANRLPALHVTVLAGTTTATENLFTDATVSIGRSADPSDDQGRLRRNRIAFLDVVDGVNETVGRAHARLRRDPVTAEYRLFDEGSRNGTSILRDGEMIVVHRRDPRGVRVRTGDEIHVGRAILRIEVR
jgi:hypothetical protein